MESPLPVIWLQRCAALAAWLWVAPGAEALPAVTPINALTPSAGAVWDAAVAGIGVVNHDGVRDPLVGTPFRRVGGIEVTAVDPNGDPVPGAAGQGRWPIGAPATATLSVDPGTLPPGTGTVNDPLPMDSQAQLSSPFTLLGQAAIAGASDAIPNGNLVYVCGSNGISVFDVTNVTAPQFLRTVGTPATACQIRGDRLVALRGGNTFVLALYTLADPRNPQRLGSTPEIPYQFAGDLVITDTRAFVTTLAFIFLGNDVIAHQGDVLSFDISVPSAPGLDDVLFDTHGTNNDGVDIIVGFDRSGGDFNVFSLTQADAQTLLAASTTVTGGDTQAGIGLVRVLDIGAPGNLAEININSLSIPGTVHLTGLAIQGNRALAVASSGGWQDPFNNQNAGLSGNVVLATLDVSDPRNPRLIATRTLSRAARNINPPVSFGNDQYAFSSLGAFSDTPQLFLVDSTDPTHLGLGQMDVPSEITRMRVAGDLLYTASASGLLIYGMNAAPRPFEAELASTQLACKRSGCRVLVTCNLAPALGTSCTNRIDLFARAPGRLAEGAAAKASRNIRFATASANVPPGLTQNVRLRLTNRGRKIVGTTTKRRLRGVMEITNSVGTAIDRTTVRIRIR